MRPADRSSSAVRITFDSDLQPGTVREGVILLDSKGKHLKGNADTNYKRQVADYFDKAGKKVTWQQLGEGFESLDHGREAGM